MLKMKKLLGIVLVFSLVVSCMIPYAASASSETLLTQDFANLNVANIVSTSDAAYTAGTAWGTTHTGGVTKSTGTSTDALIDAFGITSDGYLGIYRDYDTSAGWHNVSHKIAPITEGNTLKIKGVFDLSGVNGYNYSFIAFNIGDGKGISGTKDSSAKNIAILERAGTWTSNVGTLARNRAEFNGDRNATDSTSAVPGQTFASPQSGWYLGDTEFTFTLAPKADDASLYIAKMAFGGKEFTLEVPTAEVVTYNTISFIAGRNGSTSNNGNAASEHSKAFVKVKNLTVTESEPLVSELTFGDIKYSDVGPGLSSSVESSKNEFVSFSDEEYLNGTSWASNHSVSEGSATNDIKIDGFARMSDGWFGVYRDLDSSKSWHAVAHKIQPVAKGNTLKITGKINVKELNGYNRAFISFNLGDGVSSLTGSETKTAKNVSIFERAAIDWGTGFGTLTRNRWNFSADRTIDTNCVTTAGQLISSGYTGEKNFEFTLAPKADSEDTYIAKTVFADSTYTVEIPWAEVVTFDTLSIVAGRNGSTGTVHTENADHNGAFVKLKNLVVEEIGAKTALETGSNTLYIPYKNSGDEAQDMVVVAAVCTSDTEQVAHAVTEYADFAAKSDNLAVTVNIDDPTTQFVKVYVFDGFENLVPITTVKSSKQ